MFAVNANFLYASMRTKERRSLDINICTKLRVPQASFALQSMKAAIMQPCEIQIKCLRGWKEYGNISHGTKAMNTKFSVMQAVLSTQLPKSPFHLLSSLLLVTLDTNAQGQRGRERREEEDGIAFLGRSHQLPATTSEFKKLVENSCA